MSDIFNVKKKINYDDIPSEDMEYFDRYLADKYRDQPNVKIFKTISTGSTNRNLLPQNFNINNLNINRGSNNNNNNNDNTELIPCGIRNSQLQDRILNGTDANEFEYPWIVAIFLHNRNKFVCSGSLIHQKVIITIAQKLEKYVNANLIGLKDSYKNELYVRAGDYDIFKQVESKDHQERDISNIIIHPQYRPASKYNNIAIIVVNKNFIFDINIKPICLPPENMIFDGQYCYTAGWGKNGTSEQKGVYQNILQVIKIPVIEKNQCERRVNQYLKEKNDSVLVPINPTILCAGGELNKDACKGDGGSPLFCPIQNSLNQYYQIGIVDSGIDCGKPVPAFYTNIPAVKNWIDYTMTVTLRLYTDIYTYFGDNTDENDAPVYQEEYPTTPRSRT
ncbi:phenoloxidase-activating factor 2-like [Condylostylus longicornis]|uniref:phenoloxidase-activating factor 2-like n=1 Tax=Condylostylus longicornis TaxID=2530218 RepID=UPI00244D9A3B|nr:phenoloxidase-activating factor 2-like [Condylostylus longicornis]